MEDYNDYNKKEPRNVNKDISDNDIAWLYKYKPIDTQWTTNAT